MFKTKSARREVAKSQKSLVFLTHRVEELSRALERKDCILNILLPAIGATIRGEIDEDRLGEIVNTALLLGREN